VFLKGGGGLNALLSNNLSMLSTKDCSSTKWMGNWVVVEPSFLHVAEPKEEPVFLNTRTMLAIVFRGFSSGKCGCVLKYTNYPVNCVQGFQLWKVWLCSEIH
jgi:hypothetical protein